MTPLALRDANKSDIFVKFDFKGFGAADAGENTPLEIISTASEIERMRLMDSRLVTLGV